MYPNLLNFRIPFPQILRVEISPFARSVLVYKLFNVLKNLAVTSLRSRICSVPEYCNHYGRE